MVNLKVPGSAINSSTHHTAQHDTAPEYGILPYHTQNVLRTPCDTSPMHANTPFAPRLVGDATVQPYHRADAWKQVDPVQPEKRTPLAVGDLGPWDEQRAMLKPEQHEWLQIKASLGEPDCHDVAVIGREQHAPP